MADPARWVPRTALVVATAIILAQMAALVWIVLDVRGPESVDVAAVDGDANGQVVQGTVRFEHDDATSFRLVAQDGTTAAAVGVAAVA